MGKKRINVTVDKDNNYLEKRIHHIEIPIDERITIRLTENIILTIYSIKMPQDPKISYSDEHSLHVETTICIAEDTYIESMYFESDCRYKVPILQLMNWNLEEPFKIRHPLYRSTGGKIDISIWFDGTVEWKGNLKFDIIFYKGLIA